MCRLFAYIGHEECLLEDMLITPKHALTHQVKDHYLPKLLKQDEHGQPDAQQEIDLRNRLFNVDGYGMGWYSRTFDEYQLADKSASMYPCLFKTIRPPINETNVLSLCQHTSTNTLLAHIRAASGATAVNMANNHPFQFGKHSFMHNGEIADFAYIKRQLALDIRQDIYEMIKGTTDSEHVAGLYMTNLTKKDGNDGLRKPYSTAEMRDALLQAVARVAELKKEICKKINVKDEPSSLNIVTTDGSRMITLRYRNHDIEHPPSLYVSTKAGVTLNRKFPDHPNGANENRQEKSKLRKESEHGKHVIVASEPITYKENDWEVIEKNTLLEIDENMKITVNHVKY